VLAVCCIQDQGLGEVLVVPVVGEVVDVDTSEVEEPKELGWQMSGNILSSGFQGIHPFSKPAW
jgi:hypothetical protein